METVAAIRGIRCRVMAPIPASASLAATKQRPAHRRRVEGDGEVGGHHDAKVHHVDVERPGEGKEQRCAQQHGRQRLDESAQQKQGHIGQQQEDPLLVGNALDPCGKLRGNLFHGHQPGQTPRGADDEQYHGARLEGVEQQSSGRSPKVKVLVEEYGDEQTVDHRHGGRFCRREDAGPDAADDDDRHHQRGSRILEGGPYFP